MKSKILALVLVMVLTVVCLAGCGAKSDTDTDTTTLTGTHKAVMTVKDYGEIHITLDADTAPITVANFIKLAKQGFYDGLTFHRVVPGFVIQGGDPDGNGTGGSDEEIKGEFALNGIENNLSHKRGVLSMARANDPDSASSQFFIVLDDAAIPSLDGRYAAFGWVTKGMEVADEIAKLPVVDSYSGLVDSSKQPVIESVKIVE
jgi:peptidyl-prolyl cis-trans isomerase B (cyclophilin B)